MPAFAMNQQSTAGDSMTVTHKGDTYNFEFLTNGIARTFDYGAKWDITFKQENGKWVPHNSQAHMQGYSGLADKLNRLS